MVVWPVADYMFYCMGIRVFRFGGHFSITYLGCKTMSATKVIAKQMTPKPGNP